MTVTTCGVQIPGGLFLPGMIIGCAIGQITTNIRKNVFGGDNIVIGQSYEIMGAAAMLAGYTR